MFNNLPKKVSQYLKIAASLFILLGIFLSQFSAVFSQDDGGENSAKIKAQTLLAKLSPSQKVGQLFLITFQGSTADQDSEIYDLIVNHQVGGVVLKRANDNFIGPQNTLESAFDLITGLHTAAASQFTSEGENLPKDQGLESGLGFESVYIPIFVGISQEGDQNPFDQIVNGLTPLPNQMAIGATWDTELAKRVGETMGKELSSLGINLFIGPSLDVLDINYVSGTDDLGTRTFGGDPYWVGQLGQAYIQGLHTSSNQKMAVIAKHFPGRGGSDRQPEEEVATVRKSLEQLKLIELSPFFAVTGNARNLEQTADGLYLSHIRYQGLQGNIRATTKPISQDSSALGILLSLPELFTWRENGGIIVSDDLGSEAIRKFYDSSGQTFDARQVVRNAFLAGNDLLYMDQILSSGDEDVYTTIINLLEYFTQKYEEDRAFSERVNESVERILTLKFRLYPSFNPKLILPSGELIHEVGFNDQISFDVANRALTLISPEKEELSGTLSSPPDSRSDIVFFTDEVSMQQCSSCAQQNVLAVDALEKAVLKVYGTGVGGPINKARLNSYSYKELNDYLDAPINRLDLESSLTKAEWIVFGQMNVDSERVESHALHRLLEEKPELIRLKRVIVFAFNTPYQLDATDISSFTAYYAVYSKTPAFVDTAARALFQEVLPTGASPVSIPAIAYDLIKATSPDPKRTIELAIDTNDSANISPSSADVPTSQPSLFLGDTITLQTGVILDQNGNPVPDGTIAKFIFSLSGVNRVTQQVESATYEGIARTKFHLQDPGMLEIRVISEPALNSEILLLEITEGQSIVVSAITPTINPEPSIKEPSSTYPNTSEMLFKSSLNPMSEWIIVIGFLWGMGMLTMLLGRKYFTLQWGVRAGLVTVICGLLVYGWIILNLPGSTIFQVSASSGKTILATLAGATVGFLFFWNKNRRKSLD